MLDVLEVPWVENLFLESFLDILRLFGGVLGVLFESCKCAGQRGSVRLIFAGGERSGGRVVVVKSTVVELLVTRIL